MKRFTGCKLCCLSTFVLGLMLFKPTQAHAQQLITFGFTGHVIKITDPLNITNGSIALGDGVNGFYTFSGSPTFTDFSQPNTSNYVFLYDPFFRPIGTYMQVGSAQLDGISTFPLLNIPITNDDPTFGDQYVIFQTTQYPGAFLSPADPSLAGTPPSFPNVGFVLSDPTDTALPSQDLLLNPPDLSKFPNRFGFVTVLNANTGDLLAEVDFSLDSLQAVPEPNAVVMLGCMLATGSLLLIGRRKARC